MTPTEIIHFLGTEQARQGITDVELLKKVKIHRTTLWRIKSGITDATIGQITAIAGALGHKITINTNTI
jgi:transcriptional regulator with XRE-family HTH domain